MKRISIGERRARLAVRHHVAPPERVPTLAEAARGVVCLHATDPSTVYLSAWARLTEPTVALIDRALYEDRELIRLLAMRRTLFAMTVEDAPILHAAASLGVARRERERNKKLFALLGVDDVGRWVEETEAATLQALERLGEATAQQLGREVPELARTVRVNVGKRYEADISMSTRVLWQLAVEGRIVRGRPLGTWISSQFRWVPIERWLGGPIASMPVDEAQAKLVRNWLARFGPGTEADLRWWTGLTAREIRAALATLGAVEMELEGGGTGLLLADDLEPTPTPAHWIALLPALDPTTMGWQARDWYLGPHKAVLFDSTGNAGPTIWADGRIVGAWAIRPTGETVTRLLDDVGRETAAAIDKEAARLTEWLESVGVVPRFPTALYRELVG